MKNILKIFLICLVALMTTNCEDNEKSPLAAAEDGVFVYVDIKGNGLIDVTEIETSAFSGTLVDPVGNVASHSFDVRAVVDDIATDFVTIYTTTSFPSDFAITAGDIATAIGVDLADFPPGTRFDFVGRTTGIDGRVVTQNNQNQDLFGEPGQRQAYNLQTFISCPVDPALIEGTYDVIQLGFGSFFGETQFTRTVVAGPEDNQITIVEGEYTTTGGEPLILDIDFATGIVLGGGKNPDGSAAISFAEGTNNLPENTYRVEGGFFFSCVGVIDLNMNFNPFSANIHKFVLQKQ